MITDLSSHVTPIPLGSRCLFRQIPMPSPGCAFQGDLPEPALCLPDGLRYSYLATGNFCRARGCALDFCWNLFLGHGLVYSNTLGKCKLSGRIFAH